MTIILSLITISLLFLITLIFALKFRDIAIILFVALTIRILFLLINNYVFNLPDAEMDARDMEEFAFLWSQNSFLEIVRALNNKDAQFYSRILGIIYLFLGRNAIMAQSISILFGVACVFIGWLLAKKIWDNNTAKKVALFIALFPSLISYSVLTMREVYISFFLLIAMLGIVNWSSKQDLKSIILIIFGFYVASKFHGASIFGLFVFFGVIFFNSILTTLKLLKKKLIDFKIIIFLIFSFIILSLYLFDIIKFSYVGSFEYASNLSNLKVEINTRLKGNAAYPDWLKLNSPYELLYEIPIRVFYFLLSPFIWDVKSPAHLIGLLDSLLYFILIFLIIKNIKSIWKKPALKLILLILIIYFIIFSVGVSNFGSGIRHRSKFVIELILLAGPLLPKFIIFDKKKFFEKFLKFIRF